MTVESHCAKTYKIGTLEYNLCKLYKKSGYLDKYGGSVLITLFTSIIFFILFGYFYVNNHLKQLKGNWPAERCNPLIMPFAGLINAPPGQSGGDYTAENFIGCVNSILESIAHTALLPVTFTQALAHTSIGNVGVNVSGGRNIMTYIRTSLENIINDIMGKVFNIFLALRRLLIKLKDILSKTGGTMTVLMYTAVAAADAIFSFFWIFIIVMTEVVVFYILLALLFLYIFIPGLPFIWKWGMLSLFIQNLLLALTILVPLIIVVLNVNNITYYTQHSACFVGNTKIAMQTGEKEIKDIRLGETLIDGGKVTAIFKCSTYQQNLYNLDNILVTGKHTVYYADKGFIDVADHPLSLKINYHSHPYVYCVNTTTKKIVIKNHIFLDWDEVDRLDIIKLNIVAKKYLPTNADTHDIHKYMDGGFCGKTMIELEDGRSVCIKDLVVNDQLRFGERVLGIVEIDATTMCDIKEFIIKDRKFMGGSNLRINDKDLGIQSTLDMVGIPIHKTKKLYHVVTDTKFLTVNGIQFFDYNGALEPILWNHSTNIIKPTLF